MQPVKRSTKTSLSRRQFLTTSAAGLASYSLLNLQGCAIGAGAQYQKAWAQAEQIRRQTRLPQIPQRSFNLADYLIQTGTQLIQTGARGDAPTLATEAFAQAIKACHNAGGGRVLVQAGDYLTGPIHLLSNVELHLEKGAHVRFVTDPQAYLPAVLTRWEGMELMGLSPLIYAYRQKNIAITGEGILDGQANRTTWWPWKGGANWKLEGYPTQDAARAQLQKDMEANVPVAQRIYAEGAYFRPPFIQPYECENVLIEGVTVTAAPFWQLNPVLCTNVTVRGVTMESLGPNSDGCDPESCKNVVIENCFFNTGDDCIAIKSGRNQDGRRINRPSENIVIRNCKMQNGHGGVVIGSEMSGGVRNVFVEDCEMSSPELERGLRIKTNSVRGGLVENFYVRRVQIGHVQTAIVIDFDYEEGDAGQFTPRVRNIDVRQLECEQAKQIFQVRGYERSPIANLHLENCNFKQADEIGMLENLDNFVARNVWIKGAEFKV